MKIRVGLSKTINLGNFENLKPSIEIEDELQKGNLRDGLEEGKIYQTDDMFDKETPEECYLRLTKLCHRLLAKEIRKFESSNTEHTEESNKPE